ncbi:MAG: hypothetical protein AAGE59_28015 [Cyanobacteria bacterium P01_F01_bin.86]
MALSKSTSGKFTSEVVVRVVLSKASLAKFPWHPEIRMPKTKK